MGPYDSAMLLAMIVMYGPADVMRKMVDICQHLSQEAEDEGNMEDVLKYAPASGALMRAIDQLTSE